MEGGDEFVAVPKPLGLITVIIRLSAICVVNVVNVKYLVVVPHDPRINASDFSRLSPLPLVPYLVTINEHQYQSAFQTNSLEKINPLPVVPMLIKYSNLSLKEYSGCKY